MKEILRSLFEITATKIIVTLLSGIVLVTTNQLLKDSNQSEEDDSNSESSQTVKDQSFKNDTHKKFKNSNRLPASLSGSTKNNQTQSSLSPEINLKNEANYNSLNNQSEYFSANQNGEESRSTNYMSTLSSNIGEGASFINNIPKEILKSDSKQANNLNDNFVGSAAKVTTNTNNTKKVANPEPVLNETSSSSTSGSASSPIALNCSTDILSGSFGNPVGVNINCNYLSNIKYCLAKDTCCDPKNTPTNYTTTIAIGAENGNYCLSYYGDSELAGLSEVVQNNFTINSTLPNLTVGTPKVYYQTTELVGESFLTSSDFGKANHYAGQINFKTNDPTNLGLNYSCQEIAENDHLTLSPIPSTTLSLFNISSLLPSDEIKIPFREDKLEYGLNYLSSFIKNNSYVIPLYSCSTSQITLEDFSFFEPSMAQASSGDNNIREFQGEFTSFGFFEDNPQVFRGPAGESTNEKTGTTLESGLFSIFY